MHQADAPQLGKTALITLPSHSNAGNPFPPALFELLERAIEFGGLGWTCIPFCPGGWPDDAGNSYVEHNRLYLVALTREQQVHPLRRVINALGRVMAQKAVFMVVIDTQLFLDYLEPAVSSALVSLPLQSVTSNGHGSLATTNGQGPDAERVQ